MKSMWDSSFVIGVSCKLSFIFTSIFLTWICFIDIYVFKCILYTNIGFFFYTIYTYTHIRFILLLVGCKNTARKSLAFSQWTCLQKKKLKIKQWMDCWQALVNCSFLIEMHFHPWTRAMLKACIHYKAFCLSYIIDWTWIVNTRACVTIE